jgi:hypothetical protein
MSVGTCPSSNALPSFSVQTSQTARICLTKTLNGVTPCVKFAFFIDQVCSQHLFQMIVIEHLFSCQQFGCNVRCIMSKQDGVKLDPVSRKVHMATGV